MLAQVEAEVSARKEEIDNLLQRATAERDAAKVNANMNTSIIPLSVCPSVCLFDDLVAFLVPLDF